MDSDFLLRLYQEGIISSLNFHFARFMTRLAGKDIPELVLAAALVSKFTEGGHTCLDLFTLGGTSLISGDGDAPLVCPDLEHWKRILRDTSVVGLPGDGTPLILDDKARLYLYRYWDYERRLAAFIQQRVTATLSGVAIPLLRKGLNRFFPKGGEPGIDWQKIAATTAIIQRFCVISGGPGTGKTTVVTRILGLLLEQAQGGALRIALTAPTGKAAARLQEAVKQSKKELPCSETIRSEIPEEAGTIHRLLQTIPYSPYFRYNAGNQLPVDVVVVDEGSMVSLALMSKLCEAVPCTARMILLGDRDQLASVEAGAVLGDICDTGGEHRISKHYGQELSRITQDEITRTSLVDSKAGLYDCMVQLDKSYRFGRESGIGELSRAVREGDGARALTVVKSRKYKDISWTLLPTPSDLPQSMRESILKGFDPYLRAHDPEEALRLFDRFRILCALREGPYGVAALNALIEQILRREHLVAPDRRWYRGRPIMITRNDYQLKLFNGDVGVLLPDPETRNELRAFFPGPEGAVRSFPVIRLPQHETVYATTVHKSQGSEFDEALLLLPDRGFPILTRELIYTGITRVRKRIELYGLEHVFQTAVSRRIERSTGLREALWGS